MAKTRKKQVEEVAAPIVHGAAELPAVTVDDYNLEIKDGDGFIGDRACKSAFSDRLEDWRKRVRRAGPDPLGETPTRDFSKKQLDALFSGEEPLATALILGAIDDYAAAFAGVIQRFMKEDRWKKTERIAIGGGFKQSQIGALAIARTQLLLRAEGIRTELSIIRQHSDDAGLIGAVQLMPPWMMKGHDAIVAVDIGGTNIRAGIVELRQKDAADFSRARVWKSDIWRHADDDPRRGTSIERLVEMIDTLVSKADKAKLVPAPVIGIACPGIIDADGSILRGGQNLPGGNWESERFNLPEALTKAIPQIGGHDTFVIMHNDAVVQGLSQVPFMQDVQHWAVLTIGTGLGNAHFSNRPAPEDKKPQKKPKTRTERK